MSEVKKKIGRPSGSKDVDSIEYQAFFVRKKVCIPEKELWALKEARAQYLFYKKKVASGAYSPMEDNSSTYLKLYHDILEDISSRIYPKLKSIEHIKSNPLEGKTPEEKLQVLDHLRQMLLEEIKNGSDPE